MLNPGYLKHLRQQSCAVCGVLEVEPHHAKTRGAGGSDLDAVPLCRHHHREFHQIGQGSFQEKYQFDFRDVQLTHLKNYIEGVDII